MSAISNNILAGASGSSGGAYDIDYSVRFNKDDSSYFTREPLTAGNLKKWTWSAWVKRSSISNSNQRFFGVFEGGVAQEYFRFNSNDTLSLGLISESKVLTTTQVFRDPSAWYHIVVVQDTTLATEIERVKLFVNGVQVTSFSSASYPLQDTTGQINNTIPHFISNGGGSEYFDGYLADILFLDGLTPGIDTDDSSGSVTGIPDAKYLTDFGEFSPTTGVWNPAEYQGNYPGNSFRLDFANTSSTPNLGLDVSGNGNDWDGVNITSEGRAAVTLDTISSVSGSDLVFQSDQGFDSLSAGDSLVQDSGAALQTDVIISATQPTQATYIEQGAGGTSYSSSDGITAANISWGKRTVNGGLSGGDYKMVVYMPTGCRFSLRRSSSQTATDIRTNVYSSNDGFSWGYAGSTYFDSNSLLLTFNYSAKYIKVAFIVNDHQVNFDGGHWILDSINTYATLQLDSSQSLSSLNSGDSVTQDASVTPTTSAISSYTTQSTPSIGDAYGGGYYAGTVTDNGVSYYLIVAPRVSGYLEGQKGGTSPTNLAYKTSNTADSSTFHNQSYGGAASAAGADGSHPLFDWLEDPLGPNAGRFDITGNSNGTGIGGYNDWYIPSLNEAGTICGNLGPLNTSVSIFQSGGSEAFASSDYRTSTAHATNIEDAYYRQFGYSQCYSSSNIPKSSATMKARAVRRTPANKADIVVSSTTDLASFEYGDAVTESNSGTGTGTVESVNTVTKTLVVNYTNAFTTGNSVVGPTKTAGSGTVVSKDTNNNTLTLSGYSGYWSAGTGSVVEGPSVTGAGTVGTVNSGTNTITLATVSAPWSAGKYAIASSTIADGEQIDVLKDTPVNGKISLDTGLGGELSGNYATLSPIDKGGNVTLSNGNLYVTCTSPHHTVTSTILVSSGKYYAEFVWDSLETDSYGLVGVANPVASRTTHLGGSTGGVGYNPVGQKWVDGVQTTGLTSSTLGDVIGIALDKDNNQVSFYKNNSLLFTQTGLNSEQPYGFAFGHHSSSGNFNFGQRPFAYQAPSGYKALCTANLPTPDIENGSDAFYALDYTGTLGGGTVTDSNANFTPDLVWVKRRNAAERHKLYDVVRGTDGTRYKHLESDGADAEGSGETGITSFVAGGFTSEGGGHINSDGQPFIAWMWDGGTAFSNSAGTNGATIASSGVANQDAGFSIVSWTGNEVSGSTIAHGLGKTPSLIITKRRTGSAVNWGVYHSALGATKYLWLDSTNAASTDSAYWYDTAPTSSVFTVGNSGSTNALSMIAYCWAPVEGYSAFGSYEATSTADGPFVYTGFRPRWLMVKNVDDTTYATAYNWTIVDTSRYLYNEAPGLNLNALFADSSSDENTYSYGGAQTGLGLDILSNGFKLRAGAAEINNGNTYIYAAFAEHPFKTARAR